MKRSKTYTDILKHTTNILNIIRNVLVHTKKIKRGIKDYLLLSENFPYIYCMFKLRSSCHPQPLVSWKCRQVTPRTQRHSPLISFYGHGFVKLRSDAEYHHLCLKDTHLQSFYKSRVQGSKTTKEVWRWFHSYQCLCVLVSDCPPHCYPKWLWYFRQASSVSQLHFFFLC